MKIETVKYKDVRSKELLYLKITNKHNKEYIVNVGEKTFKEVSELIEDEGKTSDEIKKIIEENKNKEKK